MKTQRRVMIRGVIAVVWIASLTLVGIASPANASTKTWTFGTYNVGAAHYGGHYLTLGGVEKRVADVAPPIAGAERWNLADDNGKKRSTWVASRFAPSFAFYLTSQLDVVAVQEAAMLTNVNISGTPTRHVAHLDSRLSSLSTGASFARTPSGDYNFYVAGKITDQVWVTELNGTTARTVGTASHIYYQPSVLSPLSSGTYLGHDLINSSYKSSYQQALGTSYALKSDINRDKIFPWTYLRTTGANAGEPNRSLVVSSVHSTVRTNYKSGTTTAQADFYNGEIMRGLSNKLRAISTGGNPVNSRMVIAGDMNSWYRSATTTLPGLSGSHSSKSPPRLLTDMTSVNWIDSRPWAQTSQCPSSGTPTGNCKTYATSNGESNGNAIDYIMTGYAAGSTTNRGFQTVGDSKHMSDHKFVATQIAFGY